MFSRKMTKSTSAAREALQGAEPVVEAADGPVVDVQVELEPGAQEDVRRMLHVGHARVAEGAHEDGRVVAGEVFEGAGRNGLARFQIVVGAPGEMDRLEGKRPPALDRFEHLDGFFRDVHPDPVAGDDGDFHGGAM